MSQRDNPFDGLDNFNHRKMPVDVCEPDLGLDAPSPETFFLLFLKGLSCKNILI